MSEAHTVSTVPHSRDDPTLPVSPLARDYYVAEQWHERDLELVFRRRWLFAGHASQVAESGQFFTFELGPDSVVVSRTADGRIAAFHNVCRHRGTKFCQERSGRVKNFPCPYHGWSYGLDGQLVLAPKMGPDFDRRKFPAKPVWIEEWNGMLFVNLAAEEPERSVADALANADFSRYDLANTKVVAERVYEVESNWKIAAETFAECYHCQINHPELCRVLDPLGDLEAWEDAESGEDDVYSGDYLIYTEDLGPAMKDGAVTLSMDGKFVCKRLLGSAGHPPHENGAMSWFPHFGMFVQPDYATTFSWLPVSPTRAVFRSTWLVHADARDGIDYDVDELVGFMHVTNVEDKELCRIAQEGICSTAYDNSAPYHPVFEAPVRGFLRTYLDHVGAAASPAGDS
jgi:Rieske 2Fe-2S family protein